MPGVGTGIGIGIGDALGDIGDAIRKRKDRNVEDREKQADALHEKGMRIAQNLQQYAMDTPDDKAIQFSGRSYKPEAAPLIDQLKQTSEQVRGLFGPHETPALVQHFRKFLGKPPNPPAPNPRAEQYTPEAIASEVPQTPFKWSGESGDFIQLSKLAADPAQSKEARAAAAQRLKDLGAAQDPYAGFSEEDKTEALRIKAGLEPKAGKPTSPKTPFELWQSQNPNGTAADYLAMEQSAKGDKPPKISAKERITEALATAYEKGDKAAVGRLQGELKAIDPQGAERLLLSSQSLSDREAADAARGEAAKTKQIAPLKAIVESAATARSAAAMGNAGNSAADVDLTLAFFNTIRGKGANVRYTKQEQDFILGARPVSESLQVVGNKVTANGQPLSTEQRKRMLDTIEMHARAAQRQIDEIQNGPATPAGLKDKAKPQSGDPDQDFINSLKK